MAQNFIGRYAASGEFEQNGSPIGEQTPTQPLREEGEAGDWIKAGDLALSPGLRKATYRNKDLRLTSAEFSILEHLLRRRGTVVAREELVQAALGRQLGALDRSIDVHISRLRKKFAQCGADDDHIKAVRGRGYLYAAVRTDVQA